MFLATRQHGLKRIHLKGKRNVSDCGERRVRTKRLALKID
jgi:hypothetical protein